MHCASLSDLEYIWRLTNKYGRILAVGCTNEGQMSLTGSKTFSYKWKQIYTCTLIYMDHSYELPIYYWGWMTKWAYYQVNRGMGLVWYFPIVLTCLL